MKGFLLSYILVLFGAAVADDIHLKQVVVSYPGATPDSVVNQAKEAILAAVRSTQITTYVNPDGFEYREERLHMNMVCFPSRSSIGD